MIGIIGSGLAGLTAAKCLNERGIDFTLIESSDRVGGRVKSDKVDGFTLDHGFQVMLTSYPQVQKHLNLNDLELGTFSPGARIFNDELYTISDPLRDPRKFLQTLFAPVKELSDTLKILSLKRHEEHTKQETISFLRDYGFSEKIIQQFFKPFFSGIFLEKELTSPANYFTFLYQRFSEGLASLPKEGMAAIPEQLSKNYKDKIKLNSKVTSIDSAESSVLVTLESGEKLEFSKIILAVEAPQLAKLFPQFNLDTSKRVVTTMYFKTPSVPSDGKYLVLNGKNTGRVNHIAFLSQVNPSYSPDGEELISVNILDVNEVDPKEILNELKSWQAFEVNDWEHLKTYPIHYAQPDQFYQGQFSEEIKNVIFAGDFTQTPSIEGAMKSGELAAGNIS